MESIGAEVGQKMRSAIKAKLMELDCYVDDELPDYIMVMVANRRTKGQMNEDLNLFLSTKTTPFVNWLHIVLKKLKEVTVTNPDVYKKATKRKSSEIPADDKSNLKLKKEKSSKKVKKEFQIQKTEEDKVETNQLARSLTDNLPIVNKLAEKRKVILTDDGREGQSTEDIVEDNFDIPLLSEVTESSNEQDLKDIERKIRNVKSRLGILVESDNDEEPLILKSEKDIFIKQVVRNSKQSNTTSNYRQISILENEITESEHRETEKPSSTTNILGKDRNIEIENDQANISKDKNVELEKQLSSEDRENEKKSQHKKITFENDEVESSSLRTRRDRLSERLRDRLRDRPQDKFRERPQERSKEKSRDRSRDRSPDRSSNKVVTGKKPSILDRLGKRPGSLEEGRQRISLSQNRKEKDRFLGYREEHRERSSSREKDRTNNRVPSRINKDMRQRDSSRDRKSRSRDRSPYKSRERGRNTRSEGIFSRVGVQSKVSVIKKPEIYHKSVEEEPIVVREVPSLIKVKPRVIPSDVPQPNKNLLLKAMADAHRSIAQTPKVGKEIKPDVIYTKKHKDKTTDWSDKKETTRRLSMEEKNKLRNIIQQSSNRMRSRLRQSSDEYDSDGEYIPKPVKNIERVVPSYTPSLKTNNTKINTEKVDSDTKENGKQQFIITLDGIDNLEQTVFAEKKSSVKLRLEGKKSPSPIIFDQTTKSVDTSCTRPNIPDKLPVVHPPLSVKNKERCKYWPGCRQSDKCEFVHPSQNCELFPQCKFGEKCLFLHPKCKFGTSCTKRDCPYDHNKTTISPKLPITSQVQNCKFFPNCTNLKCPFYHPKSCKYGKYCKNISDCPFSHSFIVNKKSLSWRSK